MGWMLLFATLKPRPSQFTKPHAHAHIPYSSSPNKNKPPVFRPGQYRQRRPTIRIPTTLDENYRSGVAVAGYAHAHGRADVLPILPSRSIALPRQWYLFIDEDDGVLRTTNAG
mmetsp:Transcript_17471/g.17671  ORF Transcript_17471/g.17671 Transcript_17471/m.17671 type:complete len:113 (-) Transcript_17471:485-823(-)